jgi:hypothetical protein
LPKFLQRPPLIDFALRDGSNLGEVLFSGETLAMTTTTNSAHRPWVCSPTALFPGFTTEWSRCCAFAAIVLWSTVVHACPRSDNAKPTTKEPDAPVARVGRYEVREFTLAVGEALTTQRGGTIILQRLDERSIVLKRTFGFTIPAKLAEISIGNHEYLRVLAVDLKLKTVRFRLRTQVSFSVWEAFSF